MANANRIIHRHSPKKSKDFHGTPHHATERIIFRGMKDGWINPEQCSVREPCAGKGDMVEVLKQHFYSVRASDIKDYRRGFRKADYLKGSFQPTDWTFINPPYNAKHEFLYKAFSISRHGVAAFLQIGFMTGQDRFYNLFSIGSPDYVYVFPDRVGSVTSPGGYLLHGWYVWLAPFGKNKGESSLRWLDPP